MMETIWKCYKFSVLLAGLVLIHEVQNVIGQTNVNATFCPVSASLTASSSDPTYQSSSSNLLLSSPLDPTVDYLCSAGSGFDANGIVCYRLNCPAPKTYNDLGQTSQYGGPAYAGIAGPRRPYDQPGGQYGGKESITVGAEAASIETAYPCWKLSQLRLNAYVYIVCFVKHHPSIIHQVIFKENSQIQLVVSEIIPNTALSAVARVTVTTEQQFSCMVAAFSSFADEEEADVIRKPSNSLAPIYHICPNNYKWYFCGNLPLRLAVDIALLSNGQNVEIFAVHHHKSKNAAAANATQEISHYSVNVDVNEYVCTSRPPQSTKVLGCPVSATQINDPVYSIYPLCGITKCDTVSRGNVTLLCCAVNTLYCAELPRMMDGLPEYSSFCTQIDVGINKLVKEKTVFLAGSRQASEIEHVKVNTGNCQLLILSSPTGPLRAYCIRSIIAAINNMTQSGNNCYQNPPVSIPSISLGKESVFHSAVSCSYKTKCCGLPHTCATCTRPTKYADRYLAELACKNSYDIRSRDDDDTAYSAIGVIPDNPYLQQSNYHGNPENYTNYRARPQNYTVQLPPYGPQLPPVGPNRPPYGPQLPPVGPYRPPLGPAGPVGPYGQPSGQYPPPQPPAPIYGIRQN